MFSKTVDSVVKGLEGMVAKLADVATEQAAVWDKNDIAKGTAEFNMARATTEIKRADRIARKIKELIA